MEGYKLKYQLLQLASQCFCVCFLLLLSNILPKKRPISPAMYWRRIDQVEKTENLLFLGILATPKRGESGLIREVENGVLLHPSRNISDHHQQPAQERSKSAHAALVCRRLSLKWLPRSLGRFV